MGVQAKAEELISNDHVEGGRARKLAEEVFHRWQSLVTLTQERHKLLTSAVGYYKILEQITPVFDNLESDYQKDEDWCALYGRVGLQKSNLPPFSAKNLDKDTFISQQIAKHLEKKDRFLRGCSYARKNSELFLKYVRRSVASHVLAGAGVQNSARLIEGRVNVDMDKLLERENKVMEFWRKKKIQLDQCQQYVLLEASARQVMKTLQSKLHFVL